MRADMYVCMYIYTVKIDFYTERFCCLSAAHCRLHRLRHLLQWEIFSRCVHRPQERG